MTVLPPCATGRKVAWGEEAAGWAPATCGLGRGLCTGCEAWLLAAWMSAKKGLLGANDGEYTNASPARPPCDDAEPGLSVDAEDGPLTRLGELA